MENRNILITSAGRRVSLVKSFKKELHNYFPKSQLFVADQMPDLSAAAQVSDQCFQICNISNSEYIDEILSICTENQVGLIIPTIDTELHKLANNIDRFNQHNIQVVVSDVHWVDLFANKLETLEFFRTMDIPVFNVYNKKDYKLPLFIKPIKGSSSKENYIIRSDNDFTQNHFNNDQLVFFEYIDPVLFDEYTCDLYYSRNGHLKCVIPRHRIKVRGGEISKGKTVKNGLKLLIEYKLKYIKGVRGPITAQFFLNKQDKSALGIEVNPRFGGGYPLSYAAGGNYPKWIIEEYFLNMELAYFDNWEANLLMLRYDKGIFVSE